MKKLLAALALAVLAACSSSNPVAPKAAVPTHAAGSRYILISGAAPNPGCTDLGNGFQSCP